MTEPLPIRIARIEAQITAERNMVRRCDVAGHDGEYEFHEKRVDDLIDLRSILLRGGVLTATETVEP